MKKAIVLVYRCKHCPHVWVWGLRYLCGKQNKKEVNPNTIDAGCPLDEGE